MRQRMMEALLQEERRKKGVFWLMTAGGVTALIVGVVSIAILAVAGLFLLATGIGALLVGRQLLGQAKAWRQRHMNDSGQR